MEEADKNDPESRLALVLLRSARLWDQAELARAAGIAPSQLSIYERGERATPREVLERAAEATGFPGYMLDPLLWTIRAFRTVARGRARLSRALAAVSPPRSSRSARNARRRSRSTRGARTRSMRPGSRVWRGLGLDTRARSTPMGFEISALNRSHGDSAVRLVPLEVKDSLMLSTVA